MSDDEGLLAAGRRRRRRPPPETASPLENKDILTKILVCLPPTPSSLPRASAVCKRWGRLVSDTGFLRRFRARHRRNPPLLGFFRKRVDGVFFVPTLDPPDRVTARYVLQIAGDGVHPWVILECRHGLVLVFLRRLHEALVWDPVTGDQRRIPAPPELYAGSMYSVCTGAVLRAAAAGEDDVLQFQVVLVANNHDHTRVCVCVYSSETGSWGNIISAACPAGYPMAAPGTVVGGSLYWLLLGRSTAILEYDMGTQRIGVIDEPTDRIFARSLDIRERWVMPAEGGVLGLIVLQDFRIKLWKRETDCHDGAAWAFVRNVQLSEVLSLSSVEGLRPTMIGFAEENNVLILRTTIGVFKVCIDSMKSKKVLEASDFTACYPFAGVYAAGLGAGGGQERPQQML